MALTRSPRRASAPRRPRSRTTPRWAWWVPFWVFVVFVFMPMFVNSAIAAIVGVFVIVAVNRRPERAILALLVVMPFHQAIFSGLYAAGVPGEVVRPAGQWKEVLIAGLVVAGFRKARSERHRLDILDWLGLGYVGLGVAYSLLPSLFVGDQVGATLDLSTRLQGFRNDVLYVALFLAARHLRLDAEARRRIMHAFILTAAVVGALAFFQYAFQDLWDTIWLDWLNISAYRLEVLRTIGDPNVYSVQTYTTVGGQELLRAGSVLIYPAALGFYGCIAAAILGDNIVRGVAARAHYIALMIVCGAVLLTINRSAILGLGVVLVATVLRRSDRARRAVRSDAARVRFALMLAIIAIFAVPAAATLGVVDRFKGNDDYSSNDSHRNSFDEGYAILVTTPLGRGLATSAGTGQRADVSGAVITESQFLQIGTQLGALGLALWAAVNLGAILTLGSAGLRAPPGFDTEGLAGARTALLGLLVAGTFLQVYIDLTLTWSLWVLAGLALGGADGEATERAVRSPSLAPAGRTRS